MAISIFDYDNYRTYLHDACAFEKKRNPNFSLRYFALKAGYPVSTASILVSVIKGHRNLSEGYMAKFMKGLGLKGKEAEYFELLVRFNQAKLLHQKNKYFEKLLGFRHSKSQLLNHYQYDFFSQWYYTAIWTLLGFYKYKVHNSNGELNKIGRLFIPPLSGSQVHKALELLKKLGLVIVDAKGYYQNAHPILSTGDEIRSIQVANYQVATMKLAMESLNRCPSETRDISTLTISISEGTFMKLKDKIQLLRKEILEMAKADASEDRIYQCNLQLFPLLLPKLK
jgi:uncharacterized protein (TIGR02147 family)